MWGGGTLTRAKSAQPPRQPIAKLEGKQSRLVCRLQIAPDGTDMHDVVEPRDGLYKLHSEEYSYISYVYSPKISRCLLIFTTVSRSYLGSRFPTLYRGQFSRW